jgi:hypothetical protein
MDVYMVKKLLSIRTFIISFISFVQLKTNRRGYTNSPQKATIFKALNDRAAVLYNSGNHHFLTINIPVL